MNEFGGKAVSIDLTTVKIATHTMIPDFALENLVIEPMVIVDHALRSMMLQIQATVTATEAKEEEYERSREAWDVVKYPKRPVRDGIIKAVASHLPKWVPTRVFLWLMFRYKEEVVVTEQVVRVQHNTYYCCPHTQVPSRGHDHVYWMGTMSGQIPREEAT